MNNNDKELCLDSLSLLLEISLVPYTVYAQRAWRDLNSISLWVILQHSLDYRLSNGRTNELKRSGRKQSYLRYYPGHFHGQTEEGGKTVMRASVPAIITTSNQSPLGYSSRALCLHQPLMGAFFYMMDPASKVSAVSMKR
jgi:hypothetical protein